MKRQERTRILIEGDRRLARRIAERVVGSFSVDVLDDPREGLVMIKVRESARRSLFYLGEALVTSCRVRIDGCVGMGIVLGEDRGLAYDLALIDAAFALGDDRFDVAAWERELKEEASRMDARRASERAAIARTRVDFSTMEVDL